MKFFSLGSVAVTLLVLTVIANAQTAATGSIRGAVTDPSGSLAPSVTVTLAPAEGAPRTATTDTNGSYQFSGIAPGSYTVRATAPGFQNYEMGGIEVAPGRAQTLNIGLTLQTQTEQVTVTADAAAQIDTNPSSNADALVLENNDMDALPDDPDDLSADLQALAGPAAGPDGAQFFIDGFTGGRLPPKQSIREIRVNQNPFAAESEHPGHGRVEILLKPGSESFHGDAYFLFSDDFLNSRNPFVTVKPPFQRRIWGGDVAGPIGKKTSFFVDVERRGIDENAIVNALTLDSSHNVAPFTQGVVTPLTGLESNIKIDRQLSTNNTFTGRYGFARDTNSNNGVGGFSLPGLAYNSRNIEHTFQAVETAILNLHTVTETRFRFRHQNTSQLAATNAPTISVLDAFTDGGSPIGNSFDHQGRFEVQNYTSWVSGKHTVRWGGLARGVSLEDQQMQNYFGTFTFTSLDSYRNTILGVPGAGPSQFSVSAGNPLAHLTQYEYGVFAQDDWRLRPNLTLSGGLRYEGQTNTGDHGDIAPRLGFAWAIGQSGNSAPKNVIRGGAGLFYSRISENYTLDAIRQNGIAQQRFLIPNPSFYPNIPPISSLTASAQPQTIRETDAGWVAPRILQTGIGYERQLPKHVTISTNYTFTGGSHSLRSRNINAPLPGSGFLPYGGANAIYLYEASGLYRQHQVVASLTARVNSKLRLSGYYTYNVAHSNTDGAGTFPANQYDLATEYSRAAYDIRHRIQLSGYIEMKWGFRLSPFVTFTTGRPFNIITGTDLNSDGLYTDRPAFAANPNGPNVVSTPYGYLDRKPVPGETIIPRNLGEGPGLFAANLRLGKAFVFAERKDRGNREIVLAVTARNLFNHPNYGQPSGDLSSLNFLHSTTLVNGGNGASGTRRIDLEIRYNF